jgi:hypothetical protein
MLFVEELFMLCQQFLLILKSFLKGCNILFIQVNFFLKIGSIFLNILHRLIWILLKRYSHKLFAAIFLFDFIQICRFFAPNIRITFYLFFLFFGILYNFWFLKDRRWLGNLICLFLFL